MASYVSSLDDDPVETIRHELIRIGIDKAHWVYLPHAGVRIARLVGYV